MSVSVCFLDRASETVCSCEVASRAEFGDFILRHPPLASYSFGVRHSNGLALIFGSLCELLAYLAGVFNARD